MIHYLAISTTHATPIYYHLMFKPSSAIILSELKNKARKADDLVSPLKLISVPQSLLGGRNSNE